VPVEGEGKLFLVSIRNFSVEEWKIIFFVAEFILKDVKKGSAD
jgi:hypothetical protein